MDNAEQLMAKLKAKQKSVETWKLGSLVLDLNQILGKTLSESQIKSWYTQHEVSFEWAQERVAEQVFVKQNLLDLDDDEKLLNRYNQLPPRLKRVIVEHNDLAWATAVIDASWNDDKAIDRWLNNGAQLDQLPQSTTGLTEAAEKEGLLKMPLALQRIYGQLPDDDQLWLGSIESNFRENNYRYVIRLGMISREVRDHLSAPGKRTDKEDVLTFSKWLDAHQIPKSTAYRAISIADGFFRIKAFQDPEESLMIENFFSLPKDTQVAIGRGKMDHQQEMYLLRATESVRNSRVWREMATQLDDSTKINKELEEKVRDLGEQNRGLANRLAASENDHSKIAEQLNDAQQRNHDLEMQLRDAEGRIETREVIPKDYDDLKADKKAAEARAREAVERLRLAEEKLKEAKDEAEKIKASGFSQEEMDAKQQEVDDLQVKTQELMEQINQLHIQNKQRNQAEEEHKRAFEELISLSESYLTSVIQVVDVRKLISYASKLKPNEIRQADLERLSDTLIDKGNQIRNEVLHQNGEGTVIDGDFEER